VILFPAIDLKDGVCVRLEQGDMGRATIFNRDPAAQAELFEAQGFEYLHLVDLDGAFAGRPMNARAVERILETISIPVELGGGIRDMATIEAWLGKGVTRVIIGTAAVRDPSFVREAAARFPDRVAVGLDARDGKVAVEGWAETSELSALEIARRFEDAGVAAIIYTDISRDGLLKGLNIEATLALADALSIPVIASGGLASLDDVEALLDVSVRRLAGAIAGRALYDGRLDAADALARIRKARTDPLTRALTRRGLMARKQILVTRIMAGHTFAAVVLDIDHLRRVNDERGHLVGDEVLRAIAAELGREKGVVVARIEGDAFAILAEDCPPAQATALAERFRGRLARLEVPPHGAIALKASVGVSSWQAGDTLDALIDRARGALDAAKHGRGDCVVAAPAAGAGAAGLGRAPRAAGS
jgi:phosphoribosylformimino-5-aminoimidazole carboxamide ribotide isomerase